jgi:HEAT repeat protein
LSSFGALADSAIPVIKHLLQSPDMASECARALCRMGSPGVEASADLLTSPEEEVRYQILNILGSLGERSVLALPAVLRCLDDPVARVRFRATQCLLSIDPSRSAEVVSRIRAASEFDRSRLVLYVAELGEPAASVLNELMRDEDPSLQELATKAFARMAGIRRNNEASR